jgi:hypothetical protein
MGLRVRLLAASLLVVVALAAGLAAHDVLAWRSALAGDTSNTASTWLPGDPVGDALGVRDDVRLRRAIDSFNAAVTTGRGFDAGETRTRRRSLAEVRLSDVAASSSATQASQAGDLLGVLVAATGAVSGGVTGDERAQTAFEAAIRRDLGNSAAKYNLELLLRRTAARSTRTGPGNGTGSQGRGRHGAGAGTPGRGY